ncbi:MAG: Endonuclease YncB [Nitrosomonadaceae bacterium]|nr:Endonuclease YncB [Nitrosomonadaceae bacterium]
MATQLVGRFLVAAGLMLAINAHADFTGKVVAVADEDTITVLKDLQQVKVRLTEIDAPEKKQAFGNRSKESLSDLCFGKTATLIEKSKDRYGRTLARVTCDGTDANAEQVRRGLAWAYTKYLTDPQIKVLEEEARASRLGLWRDETPVPPWEWRHRK